MNIIKKIINWFLSLFRKLFKKNKKMKSSLIKDNERVTNNKINSIKETYNGSLPSYMFISNREKEKLLYSLSLMINLFEENNNKILAKEKNELIKYIQNISKLDKDTINKLNEDELFNKKNIELITENLSIDDKNVIIDKYNSICKCNSDFRIHLDEVNRVIKLIEKNNISIIAEDEIEHEISVVNSDKDNNKINNFNKKVFTIIDNIDEDFINEVLKEYEKVNYVTISTTIIDKNYERLTKLEDDFKHHRFNKYYYEREINKLKKELNKLKNLKNTKEVSEHINALKQELYTKSKDKYDLLYNNEIFMNFENECDNLLNKINAKVIDIKKEKEKDDSNKINDDYIKRILLRFEDMELAREIILKNNEELVKLSNKNDIINYVNLIYNKFNIGIDNEFNYDKNRKRTELVVLYNDINKVISLVKKEPCIPVEHINFRIEDLIEASIYKKDELDTILHNNRIIGCDSSIIDEKLDILVGNNKKNNHVLKKENDKK